LGIIIPTDFHIFQRGRPTTNQLLSGKHTINYGKSQFLMGISTINHQPVIVFFDPVLAVFAEQIASASEKTEATS